MCGRAPSPPNKQGALATKRPPNELGPWGILNPKPGLGDPMAPIEINNLRSLFNAQGLAQSSFQENRKARRVLGLYVKRRGLENLAKATTSSLKLIENLCKDQKHLIKTFSRFLPANKLNFIGTPPPLPPIAKGVQKHVRKNTLLRTPALTGIQQ